VGRRSAEVPVRRSMGHGLPAWPAAGRRGFQQAARSKYVTSLRTGCDAREPTLTRSCMPPRYHLILSAG
jgi:hypothetical protein